MFRSLKKIFRKRIKKAARWAWQICAGLVAASVCMVVLYRFIPVPVTPLMLIRCVEQKMDGQKMQLAKTWVPLKMISPYLPIAVFVAEDQRFLEHHGFDFKMIEQAIENNKSGKRIRGASTITQQTAKNVFLWPGRSWLRKGLEAYFTVLIEFFWDKKRIMEVYLNVIETGDGIYGAQATAGYFFNKPAKDLNPEESALIAAILPKPRSWSIENPGVYVQERQFSIYMQMAEFNGGMSYESK